MTSPHVNARVQKHRDALRKAGLRPVQLWVPDTRAPEFADAAHRASLAVAAADRVDDTQEFIDAATADLWNELPG